MIKKIITASLASFCLITHAQDSVRLFDCYKQAAQYFPVYQQSKLYAEVGELKDKNLKICYLPSVNLNAQASYQSDVTSIDLSKLGTIIPGFQSPDPASKDQYKIYLDVNQLIYDGGLTTARRNVEKANISTQQKNADIELYQINDRINQYFFAILFLQENEKTIALYRTNLEARIKILESGMRNGTVLEGTYSQVKAEYVKTGQQLDEIAAQKASIINSLSELTGTKLSTEAKFSRPQFENINKNESIRPELEAFDLQKSTLDANKQMLNSTRMPRLSAFAQGGYGRPGLNMLNNNFDTYYMVGLRLSWNVFDWNSKNNDIKQLDLQQNIIDTRRQTFEINQRIGLGNEKQNMEKYQKLMASDNELIELRSKVAKMQTSKFENGTIDAADYLTALNDENQARINLNLHQMQYLQAKANYLYISGKANK
jgi:outer membrane protein TolC